MKAIEFKLHQNFPDELKQEWNALLAQSILDVPFLRYEYLHLWWQTRGGGEWQNPELTLVTAHQDGHLTGIAPLFFADYQNQPTLLFLGSIEISDYLDFIVSRDNLATFCDELLPFLAQAGLPAWKNLALFNFLQDSPSIPILESAARQQGWAFHSEMVQPAPHIPLPGDWEAYLASIDKKQRHEIRRKIRRLESSEYTSRWYFVEDPASVENESQDFLRLMEQESQKANFLTPPMREQMRAAIHSAFEQGYLKLAFLEIDGKKAAAKFCFDYNNRLLAYNSGVDHSWIEFSPGWVLLGYMLQWANEQKRSEFDFMRGNEEYKYRFGGIDRFVWKTIIRR